MSRFVFLGMAAIATFPFLQSCQTVDPGKLLPVPTVAVSGMLIRNDLAYPVRDVMINIPSTGAFAGCGNIMPGTDCRTSFETVDYAGQPLVVSWTEHGQAQTTGEFDIKDGSPTSSSQPAWLEVIIFAAGQAGARLVRDQP